MGWNLGQRTTVSILDGAIRCTCLVRTKLWIGASNLCRSSQYNVTATCLNTNPWYKNRIIYIFRLNADNVPQDIVSLSLYHYTMTSHTRLPGFSTITSFSDSVHSRLLGDMLANELFRTRPLYLPGVFLLAPTVGEMSKIIPWIKNSIVLVCMEWRKQEQHYKNTYWLSI